MSRHMGLSIWTLVVIAAFTPAAASAAGRHATVTETDDTSPDGQDTSPPPATLTGEWGGLRTKARDAGVDLLASYGSQSAWNPQGGQRERVRETGQLALGARIDTARLIGLRGGIFQATVTYRRGKDLGADAGLGVLQQVQEVYGRGQTWRLTQLWYQQSLANGHFDVKIGRLTQGEDFGAFSCQFMNLSFCGSPMGNLAGDYWYNWPISQWAVRARVRNERFYAMVGAYESNPRNLDKTFTIGHFHGATGVLVPIELGYTPHLGAARLPGYYRAGGWYNSANADDIALDINGSPQAVTGVAPLRHTGRYGFYAQIQQQLTGAATEGPGGPRTASGLVGFLNFTQTDRKTTVTDNQVAAGLFYTGLIAVRPKDDIGLAVARTNVNGRLLAGSIEGAARAKAEYALEVDYGLQATGWLLLRPNLQYIIDPGGYPGARDVVILGVKALVTL